MRKTINAGKKGQVNIKTSLERNTKIKLKFSTERCKGMERKKADSQKLKEKNKQESKSRGHGVKRIQRDIERIKLGVSERGKQKEIQET